jgi:hypothetical protein
MGREMIARACLAVLLLTGCSSSTADPPAQPIVIPPVWAADFAKSYTQVRPCGMSPSPDHDFHYVTIWTDKASATLYQNRDPKQPLADGAVVLKPEYEDKKCTVLITMTAMRREKGFDAMHGDWHWQKADKTGTVVQDGKVERCFSCHGGATCPYDWTCSE